MGGSLLNSGEYTGGFDDVVDTDGTPGDVGGVSLGKDGDGLVIDDEFSVFGLDGSLVATVGRIVLEHVDLSGKRGLGLYSDQKVDEYIPCSSSR